MAIEKSLQELLFPDGVCFGCGPANPRGLHLRSFPGNGEVVAKWSPSPEYGGWPGIMCGGVLSTLLDCHAVITAIHEIMERDHLTIVEAKLNVGEDICAVLEATLVVRHPRVERPTEN